MPTSNTKKVAECLEIVKHGIFDAYEIAFLRDMEQRLQDPDFKLSLPRQRMLDKVYQIAWDSPY